MKKTIFIALTCVALFLAAPTAIATDAPAELTYAIEINEVICGYADVSSWEETVNGTKFLKIKQNMFMMLTVLGAEVNTRVDVSFDVDPETERFVRMISHIDQGDIKIDAEITVDGDTAHCYSSLTGRTAHVFIPDGTIMDNSVYSYHLIRDFVEGGATEKTYNVFNAQDFSIQENTCKRAGSETLELAGKQYETIIIDTMNSATGMPIRSWIDVASGIGVKVRILDNRLIYLADPSVKKQIELVNFDENIATKTNESISDVSGINYMKVRAKIKPAGLWLESEDLSVPGQKFEGTVTDNLIEGKFEIEHPRCDGADAPSYPPDYSKDKDLDSGHIRMGEYESMSTALNAKDMEIVTYRTANTG